MADETPADIQPKTVASFWSAVKSSIDTQTVETVEGRVVEHYTKKEIDARVQKTIDALEALKVVDSELRKKPDTVTFDAAGNELAAVYSKGQHEARKKQREKADKIHTALTDVFNLGNFDKLGKLKIDASGKVEEEDAAA